MDFSLATDYFGTAVELSHALHGAAESYSVIQEPLCWLTVT